MANLQAITPTRPNGRSVVLDMLSLGHPLQVLQSVITRVFVLVVDKSLRPIGDRTVRCFPDESRSSFPSSVSDLDAYTSIRRAALSPDGNVAWPVVFGSLLTALPASNRAKPSCWAATSGADSGDALPLVPGDTAFHCRTHVGSRFVRVLSAEIKVPSFGDHPVLLSGCGDG